MTRWRLLATGGVIGPLAFVGAWVLGGSTTSGYSPVDDAISELARVGASTRALMTAGFVIFGFGLLAFAASLRHTLRGRAWTAAAATGVCTFGVAATPLGGWSGDGAHAVFASLGYVTLATLPCFASREFARLGRREWARASVTVAAVSAIALVVSAFASARGFWQRVGLTVGDVWIAVIAICIIAAIGPMSSARDA